jgi:hypothetical protein
VRKILISVVVLVVLGAAAAVAVVAWPKSKSPSSTATTAVTTTTLKSVPIAPLTGLPDPSGTALTRPALTVKIENDPNSLPQFGVDQADVVYEEIVNGGITRLAAIFNSQAPAKAGPVRSVRPTDTQIVSPIGGIFAYSGGAAYAVASIETAPVKLIDESNAGAAMFRDPNRYPPYNLYGIVGRLFAFGGTPTPPKPIFTYLSAGQSVAGAPVAKLTVEFPSIYPVTWTWDTKTASWDRTLFGQPDVTGTGVRESPTNVIVMWVNYVNGIGTMASYANLQGSGTAAIFTDGKEVHGTWARGPLKTDPLTYQTDAGKVIALTPGQTWVELLDVGAAVDVTK